MDSGDLANRFRYHPPVTATRQQDHERVRELCWDLANQLNAMLPEGREKAVAVTNLEQVMFWANAAIARQPQEPQ